MYFAMIPSLRGVEWRQDRTPGSLAATGLATLDRHPGEGRDPLVSRLWVGTMDTGLRRYDNKGEAAKKTSRTGR